MTQSEKQRVNVKILPQSHNYVLGKILAWCKRGCRLGTKPPSPPPLLLLDSCIVAGGVDLRAT